MLELNFEVRNDEDEEEVLECQLVLLLEGSYPLVVVEPFVFYRDTERLANQLLEQYQFDPLRLIWLEYRLWEDKGKLEVEFRQSEFRWSGHHLVHDGWPQISQHTLKALLELALAQPSQTASVRKALSSS